MKQIYYFITLSRPANVTITGLSVFLGAIIGGNFTENSYNVLLAVISGAIVAAAGNVINDIFDIEIDRINKPNRPLPSNRISKKSAILFYCILCCVSIILSFFIKIHAFFIVIITHFLLFIYSFRLKKTIIWGNVTVSFICGLAFIYGGISVNHWEKAIIPAAFAFLFHFGREILKDMEDREGDRNLEANTFPINYGLGKALTLVNGIFILLIIGTFIPFVFDIYNIWYLIIVVVGVDLGLIYFLISLHRKISRDKLHRINNILKFQMIIGIVSIYIGTLS